MPAPFTRLPGAVEDVDPNHGPALVHGWIAYNRTEERWCKELKARAHMAVPIQGDGGIQLLRRTP
jgi:hypothetical protein